VDWEFVDQWTMMNPSEGVNAEDDVIQLVKVKVSLFLNEIP
jgi:hypothetical protein